MKNNIAIHFIMTGGTIDSYYEGRKDTVVPYKNSIIPEYISNLKLGIQTEFTQVCMKDSREITLEDMETISKIIQESKYKHFIITHGTYCMPDTARYLQSHLKRNDCVVILTGSMVPLGFLNSDAGFNLGYSISELSYLSPGIYVCMNGEIFKPEEVAKLISQGRFISIFTNK